MPSSSSSSLIVVGVLPYLLLLLLLFLTPPTHSPQVIYVVSETRASRSSLDSDVSIACAIAHASIFFFFFFAAAGDTPASLVCLLWLIASRRCHGGGRGSRRRRLLVPPLGLGAWYPRPRHRTLCPPAGSARRIVHGISMYMCLESNWVLEAGVRACVRAFRPALRCWSRGRRSMARRRTRVSRRLAQVSARRSTARHSSSRSSPKVEKERETCALERGGQALSKAQRCDAWINRQSMRLFPPSLLGRGGK